jgi:UDP-N-acetylbacillosamine N-acetyltransferase
MEDLNDDLESPPAESEYGRRFRISGIKEPLLIWGAGAHAAVVADIVRSEGRYEIAGFLDDVTPGRSDSRFSGAPLHTSRDALRRMREEGVTNLIAAVGDCAGRARCAEYALRMGFQLARAIHPRAIVAIGAFIGDGAVISAGAVVSVDVRIGDNAIVNTGSTVDHGTVIEDAAHISAGVCVGGRVTIGEEAFVGMGATILTDVRVGSRSLIGAGALVLGDVPDGHVAYGVPARVRGEVPAHG